MSDAGALAAFLDRDGTIIHDANYIASPEQVALLPGAAAAIASLNEANIPVVVVTNQSGIARGLLTPADYEAVHARMVELLGREGASIDAAYYCPHHPDISGACECRKPGTLLYRRAAEEHGLRVEGSLFAGDHWRDVEPAVVLGGHGVLVPAEGTRPDEIARATQQASVAATLMEAVARWMSIDEGPGPRAQGSGKD
jgi:histidinol-phosphate phosphatase family protein